MDTMGHNVHEYKDKYKILKDIKYWVSANDLRTEGKWHWMNESIPFKDSLVFRKNGLSVEAANELAIGSQNI
jgi:hypothetical protein